MHEFTAVSGSYRFSFMMTTTHVGFATVLMVFGKLQSEAIAFSARCGRDKIACGTYPQLVAEA